MSKENAQEYCERKYPQTTSEFKKILDEMYVTFCKKQRNYGPGNISVGSNLESDDDKKIALTGLWFRKNDKIQRLLQLVSLVKKIRPSLKVMILLSILPLKRKHAPLT